MAGTLRSRLALIRRHSDGDAQAQIAAAAAVVQAKQLAETEAALARPPPLRKGSGMRAMMTRSKRSSCSAADSALGAVTAPAYFYAGSVE